MPQPEAARVGVAARAHAPMPASKIRARCESAFSPWAPMDRPGNDRAMLGFRRNAQGQACLGETPLSELLASAGLETPVYFYDLDAIAHEARALSAGYGRAPHVIAYAVKANSAGSVVRTLAAEGTGADVVSAAELEVVLGCGIPANKIVMSGVAKKGRRNRARYFVGAIRDSGRERGRSVTRCGARARALGRQARIGLRLNPGVEALIHLRWRANTMVARWRAKCSSRVVKSSRSARARAPRRG